MNRGDLPSRDMQWHDAPMTTSASRDVMEWEANLLLPQMAAAQEHPCSAASPLRLVELWRALRTGIAQPAASALRH